MSFNDRYAITEFNLKTTSRLSFSIDERGDEICAVLLYVPVLSERDHYHVSFKKNELSKLLNILNKENGSLKADTNYKISYENMIFKIIEEYKGNQTILFDLKLNNETINKIKDWINVFLNYNEKDLKDKYYKDLKNIK